MVGYNVVDRFKKVSLEGIYSRVCHDLFLCTTAKLLYLSVYNCIIVVSFCVPVQNRCIFLCIIAELFCLSVYNCKIAVSFCIQMQNCCIVSCTTAKLLYLSGYNCKIVSFCVQLHNCCICFLCATANYCIL